MNCTVEGCDLRAIARGWCNVHYRRWKRYGDPTIRSNPTGRSRRSVCVNGHKLATDNIYTAPNGKRQCRACMRHRSKLFNRKRRAEGVGQPKDAGWHRQYRAEVKAGIRTVNPRPRQRPPTIQVRVLDLLCIEEGWWEPEEMADRLGLNADSLKRTMYRCEQAGLVEHRNDPLRYRATPRAREQVA